MSALRCVRRVLIVIKSLLADLWNTIADRMPFRHKLCRIFGHQYPAFWLKSEYNGSEVGIADTSAGCRFCGSASAIEYPVSQEDIDYNKTRHQTRYH